MTTWMNLKEGTRKTSSQIQRTDWQLVAANGRGWDNERNGKRGQKIKTNTCTQNNQETGKLKQHTPNSVNYSFKKALADTKMNIFLNQWNSKIEMDKTERWDIITEQIRKEERENKTLQQ